MQHANLNESGCGYGFGLPLSAVMCLLRGKRSVDHKLDTVTRQGWVTGADAIGGLQHRHRSIQITLVYPMTIERLVD